MTRRPAPAPAAAPARHPPRQHGAALLMAMIIVTLVATLASAMVWQQWRAVRVEAAERGRMQAEWIVSGAVDWARLILREDARSGGADSLGEPWATPLEEARLSTFLAADKDGIANADADGPEAFLSGRIEDLQSRYNLRNVIDANKIVPAELKVLQKLFDSIGAGSGLAQTLADGLRTAGAPGDGGSAALMPQSFDQLAWLGVDEATLKRLEPHVTLLPVRTTVNVNTASREVIAAVIDGLDLGAAARIVQARQRSAFLTLETLRPQLPGGGADIDLSRVGVSSNYFQIFGRMRLDNRIVEERWVVERRGLDIVPLAKRTLNLADTAR